MASLISPTVPLWILGLIYMAGILWLLYCPTSFLEEKAGLEVMKCPEKTAAHHASYTAQGCKNYATAVLSVVQLGAFTTIGFHSCLWMTAGKLGQESIAIVNLAVIFGLIYQMIEFFFYLPDWNQLREMQGKEDYPTWVTVVWWVVHGLILLWLFAALNKAKLRREQRDCCNQLYWSLWALVPLCLCGWVMTRFMLDDVLESMGLEPENAALAYTFQNKFLRAATAFINMHNLQIALVCIGIIFSGDRLLAYASVRMLWVWQTIDYVARFCHLEFYKNLGYAMPKNNVITFGVINGLIILLAWNGIRWHDKDLQKPLHKQAMVDQYDPYE